MFAGTVSGKVTYTGTPVRQKPIDMSKEPSCAKQHATPITTETVVTGANNALENVVVYVSPGPDDASAPSQAVTFAQKGCQYIPHVIAMHTDQEFQVLNDDQTSHNIHPMPKVNREWNKSQPPGSPPIQEKFDQARVYFGEMQHPSLDARLVRGTQDQPLLDLPADGGGFTLPNLPPGKYTITAWHEDYGTQTQDVTITGNETKSSRLHFQGESVLDGSRIASHWGWRQA